MRRRHLLAALGAGSTAAVGRAAAADDGEPTERAVTRESRATVDTATGRIDPLAFDSTCSLLDADEEPVTGDPEYVVATAESTAFNEDANGDDSDLFTPYPDDTDIPLVAAADGVVAVGAVFLQDGTGFRDAGNEEFVANVLDEEAGTGTVLWDEGHGQFFDTSKHLAFTGYVENEGYDVVGTESLAADLDGDDVTAAVVTTPAESFTDAELDAVASFVADGGTLLLFGQSDFGGFNQPANLNEVCVAVDAPFRFNDDQVLDFANNAGIFFVPSTDAFDTSFPYFADRPGIAPPELERGRRYTVDVLDVADGDTVDVQFQNGYVDEVRLLGIDTPETFLPAELRAEWEGIDDDDYLAERGEAASTFAREQLAGETVELAFDAEADLRGGFGRLLSYLYYDADGDGSRDTSYNRRIVREGYGRVYDSGFSRHDAFLALEQRARREGRGVWAESDVDAAPALADRPARVDQIFVPRAAPVTTADGASDSGGSGSGRGPAEDVSVVARASESASRGGAPLAAVDDRASVALVGGQLLDEDYGEDDTPVDDPTAYDGYQFAAGLAERLTTRAGGYLIDGGHGQFGADRSVSAEDAAFFGRYLEGLDETLTQYNDLATSKLSSGRVLFVSAPTTGFSDAELDAVNRFRRGGGCVVVFAGRDADRAVTNELLAELDTTLRLGEGVVDDPETNAGEATLPVATDVPVAAPAYDENEGEGGTVDRGRGSGRGRGRGRGDDRETAPGRSAIRHGRAPLPAAVRGRGSE
ncbi:DUF4350 domain-containing protein [Halobaculum sp. MBLA0147]|uniref:DUF4350 domain-containing protein n=1 Tax=Halobaculum sp. MBLA0147 TaxID=3079934 RepID=UPI00352621B0